MKVLKWPADEVWSGKASALTIGVFDGLHLGHQEVFRTLRDSKGDLPWGALTFHPHPKEVLTGSPMPLIQPLEARLAAFEAMGLDFCMLVTFTKSFSQIRANDFWTDFLTTRLKARHLVVGYDLCIGHKQEAGAEKIRAMGEERGVSVIIVPPCVTEAGEKIASSLVRQTLAEGDVKKAACLLGKPFRLTGAVVRDRGLGATIGFPTANLEVTDGQLLPAKGVYATWITLDGHQGEGWPGAMNIGTRPTTGDGERVVPEVHLIGYNGSNLTGLQVHAQFVDYLRPEKKFSNIEHLKSQITLDVENVRSSFINQNVKQITKNP